METVRKIGIGIASALLALGYVFFLQVMIWPAFIVIFTACGLGLIFADKE